MAAVAAFQYREIKKESAVQAYEGGPMGQGCKSFKSPKDCNRCLTDKIACRWNYRTQNCNEKYLVTEFCKEEIKNFQGNPPKFVNQCSSTCYGSGGSKVVYTKCSNGERCDVEAKSCGSNCNEWVISYGLKNCRPDNTCGR